MTIPCQTYQTFQLYLGNTWAQYKGKRSIKLHHQHLAVQWLLHQFCGVVQTLLLVIWCGCLSWIEEQRRKWRFGKLPESGLDIEASRLLAHIRHGHRQGAGHRRPAMFLLLMSCHHLCRHCGFLPCLFKGRQGLCVIACLVLT